MALALQTQEEGARPTETMDLQWIFNDFQPKTSIFSAAGERNLCLLGRASTPLVPAGRAHAPYASGILKV